MIERIALGFVLSLAIGLLAYRLRALTASGALGAALLGTLTLGLGGWAWAWLLIGFFSGSSALSRLGRRRKAGAATVVAKGGRRDLVQVLANGGIAGALAIGQALWPSPIWYGAYAGTLAAANADTWSTEIGLLARQPPRLITTGRRVLAGTSGGVSPAGTLAGLAGGLVIGLLAAALRPWAPAVPPGWSLWLPLLGLMAGLGGGLADSLLGATAQARYRCQVCGQATERRVHHEQPTEFAGGWPWLNNDGVNLAATLGGAAVGALAAVSLYN